jgi:hypothetical protein
MKDGALKYEITHFRLKHYYVSNGSSYDIDTALEDETLLKKDWFVNYTDALINNLIETLMIAIKTPVDESW